MNFIKKLFGKSEKPIRKPIVLKPKLSELSDIYNELGAETLACIPDEWNHAELSITCDGQRIDYKLKNLRGEPGVANISPQLAKLTEKLYLRMSQDNNRWTSAVLQYEKNGDNWKFHSKYSYS